ncbi:MAG: ABC transporter ATP-binding protein [Pseudomonadota bacterium]
MTIKTGNQTAAPDQKNQAQGQEAAGVLLKIANIETPYFDRIYALHGLSLEVREREIFAVLGPNGAGKTTLLKTVAGLLKDQPKKGAIEFMGRRIHRRPPEFVANLGIVYVPEDRGLFRELTVKENLDLGCWGRKGPEVKLDLDFVYGLFPILFERQKQQAETLSGGQQQMLAVARAMLRRPKLLMLDEPSLGLAPLVARNVYEALVQIARRGTTILLVEQNARMALGIADYGYIMEAGRIVLEGTSRELKENEDVQELYLGLGGEDSSSKGWRLYKKRRTW